MSLAECVELMFRNAGIRPHIDGNKYLAEVQARHCVFTPVLVVEGNRLIIMVRFPAPVPEQFAYSVNYEVERINGMYRNVEVTLSHNDGGDFSIYSMIIKEYDSVSAKTADEIRILMLCAVDALDEDNFKSLMCSLIGHRDYSELEARVIEGSTVSGEGDVQGQIPGGYVPLLKGSGDISCPRFLGRLLVYATDIIEKKISKEVASDLLTRQTPFDEIVQRAYDVADENERDLLRKLRYLGKAKATDHDDDNDFMIGRLEALGMIQGNPWALLSGEGLGGH